MIYANTFKGLAVAMAVAGGLMVSSPSKADGFFHWVPILGPAGDAYLGAIRDRSSDASVFNHAFGGLGQYNQPFRPATPGPSVQAPPPPIALPDPAVQYGNFCATPSGRFGPGPINPVGVTCNVVTPNGVIFGQVTL